MNMSVDLVDQCITVLTSEGISASMCVLAQLKHSTSCIRPQALDPTAAACLSRSTVACHGYDAVQ